MSPNIAVAPAFFTLPWPPVIGMVVEPIRRDPVTFCIMSHWLELVSVSPVRFSVLAPERPLPIAVAWPFMSRAIVWGCDSWSACASVGVREMIAIARIALRRGVVV